MSVYGDIRAALEQGVVAVSGFPSSGNRAWENVSFGPTTGTPWAKMVLIPVSRTPAVMGPSPTYLYKGIFGVNLFYPEGDGPASADALADTIVATFDSDFSLTHNSVNVRFNFAERKQGMEHSPWYMVPVYINWFTYHT